MTDITTKIDSAEDFKQTPEDQARYWQVEMDACKEEMQAYWKRGDKVIKKFVGQGDRGETDVSKDTRVNLFSANVQTLRSLLYGKTPDVEVKRKFADPGDDVARLSGEILQRLLNTDIDRDDDAYADALEMALDDRLLPGMGVVRARYEAVFEEPDEVPAQMGPCPSCRGGDSTECPQCGGTAEVEVAPAYTPEAQKALNDRGESDEEVATDYIHWRDFRYSPARNWTEVRWVAFRALMSRDQLVKRFGAKIGNEVPLNHKNDDKDQPSEYINDPWGRAEVWEIWHKDSKKVLWWVSGYGKLLDSKEDPYGLDGFWPCPRPMFANLTTSKLIPVPDYILAEDLYEEIDEVSARIVLLEQAVAVRGVYDQNSSEVKQLLTQAKTNDMLGMADFALFKEKGGLAGVIDFLPIDMIVGALDKLREYRGELINLLYQVTGFSDIMRGQSAAGTTATTDALKAKFASVRMQAFQSEFARFASEVQGIKAELVCKFFDPETIVKRANVRFMPREDQANAMQAVELLKSDLWQYRVTVKPEAISMADYAAIKQERTEFLTGVATFLQSSLPMMQAAPWATPFLLQMLQWAAAGFRNGTTIEGVLDQAVNAAQQQLKMQAMQPPQPNPQLQVAQIKAEAEGQKAKADVMQSQLDLKAHVEKTKIDLQKAQADHTMSMQKLEAQMRSDALRAALPQETQPVPQEMPQ